jgi:hypothetical protein
MTVTGPGARAGRHRTTRDGRARKRVAVIRVGAILLLVAAAGVGAYFVSRSSGFHYRFATARAENTAGGYAFSYPPSWPLSRERTTSKLTAPDGTVVVSLGRGASTPLPEASTILVNQIKQGYQRVKVLGSKPEVIGGVPALTVSGTGRNTAGISLRFLAVTIQGPGQTTFAITAFTVANADPSKVVPPLSDIVDSFRVT